MSDDIVNVSVPVSMATQADLGAGLDTVLVSGPGGGPMQVRLTFTSAEVGNGTALDAGTMTNQDGGLAVRLQAEGAADVLSGPVSRFDDEGIRFESTTPGLTFEVRDLVSGASRGDAFSIAQLGTLAGDEINFSAETRNVYVNAGMGNDTVKGGFGHDFLVGGGGDDLLRGGGGDDTFIAGAGNDVMNGGKGADTVVFNPATDGMDMMSLGEGRDVVNVGGAAQVRLTFTSAEVGNGNASDMGTLANQDGGLAVRVQAEDAGGMLTGPASRTDDEGIRFVATGTATFDVRDLVSGAQRGDLFRVAELGTLAGDRISHEGSAVATYVNAGGGDDVVIGGMANDFLVGNLGNDTLRSGEGTDTMIGGVGADRFVFYSGDGNDTILDFAAGDLIDLKRLDVAFADLTIMTAGGVTTVGIDTDGDLSADMVLTLANGAAVAAGDFVF
jgi:Ca2+-binding RTX toxin-like protein